MKKKNSKLSGFYLGLIFVLMYLPIAVVIVFSFNESKLPVRFTGFSLKWYQELIHDDAMIEALGNSLFLGVVSCLVSAVIGTLGAVGLSRIHWKTKGILEYISILPLMIPEIILGMVLMAFFYMMNLPFGMLTLLSVHPEHSSEQSDDINHCYNTKKNKVIEQYAHRIVSYIKSHSKCCRKHSQKQYNIHDFFLHSRPP